MNVLVSVVSLQLQFLLFSIEKRGEQITAPRFCCDETFQTDQIPSMQPLSLIHQVVERLPDTPLHKLPKFIL
jgi:hypothetical protein